VSLCTAQEKSPGVMLAACVVMSASQLVKGWKVRTPPRAGRSRCPGPAGRAGGRSPVHVLDTEIDGRLGRGDGLGRDLRLGGDPVVPGLRLDGRQGAPCRPVRRRRRERTAPASRRRAPAGRSARSCDLGAHVGFASGRGPTRERPESTPPPPRRTTRPTAPLPARESSPTGGPPADCTSSHSGHRELCECRATSSRSVLRWSRRVPARGRR